MAYLSETSRNSWIGYFTGWFEDISNEFSTRRARREAYQRTYRELNSMNEKELADIGLSKFMIHDIAEQAADMAVAK